jgi:hypothetical protein
MIANSRSIGRKLAGGAGAGISESFRPNENGARR